jgi:hypothetical protein
MGQNTFHKGLLVDLRHRKNLSMSRVKKSFPYYKISNCNLTEKNEKKNWKIFFFENGHGKVFPVTRDKNAIQASKYTAAIWQKKTKTKTKNFRFFFLNFLKKSSKGDQ